MMRETFSSPDHVINVIEQDSPRAANVGAQSGGKARARERDAAPMDAAAVDALAARRRREFDAARARLRDQAMRDDTQARQPDARPIAREPPASDDTGNDAERVPVEQPRQQPLGQPPERVRKRYLRAGNQYFLKDAPYQLAFEDLGPYLVTEHNRPDVVESMVDMAAARSWQRIRVSGHEAFCSEVWLQATVLGIGVSGYEPRAADLARLADSREARLNNRIEADASMPAAATSAQAGDIIAPTPAPAFWEGMPVDVGATSRMSSPRFTDEAPLRQVAQQQVARQQAAGDEPDTPRRYAGELRAHGRAPYQNNPARTDSYYVVLRDASGTDHVLWGVDLERAVQDSRAEPGQQVALENLGRQIVTVKVPILDAQGKVAGEEEKDVYRHTWQVDLVEPERSAASSMTRPEATPDAVTKPVDGSTRANGQGRPRTTVSDEDKVLHLAVLIGAMREQGFSARSIARVRQRAEAMLDAFGKDGVQVPRPRVFDPKAPSERERRTRGVPDRSPSREIGREIERAPAEPSLPTR